MSQSPREKMTENTDETLQHAVSDEQTVESDGTSVRQLSHGVTFRDAVTHIDDRGSIVELFDTRWDWHPDPLVYAYCFTIRPGKVKGWGLHKKHEDRYFVLQGEMEVVMYDVRPDSPTFQQISKVVLSGYNRQLMNIPTFIWHCNHNIGTDDVVVVNFPTAPYEHESPDKYRLPLDTDLIPYSFGDAKGW